MKTKLCALMAVLCACLPLAACGKQAQAPQAQGPAALPAMVMAADPQGAIDEIYRDIGIKEIAAADDTLMEDTLGFDLTEIEAYYVRYSSGRYGLADVYIIRPTDEGYDAVREQLESVKLSRIRSTENFDVLDANKIAQNAQIFQYGSYLIMLMLADNDTAAEIIERYLPSTEMDEGQGGADGLMMPDRLVTGEQAAP